MPMRPLLLAAAALLALAAPAQAFDCRKASTAIEHAICDDPGLKAADVAMGQAYGRILKAATGDAEIREMLVASQKRWLAARDLRLAGPDDDEDGTAWQGRLLKAVQDRTARLKMRSGTDPKQFDLIATAEAQRRFAARFSGGPFARFRTGCDFLPSDGRSAAADVYGCFATRFYQNKDRICGVSEDWASGAVYETHSVADVVDGKPKTVATCSVEGAAGEPPCPDGDRDGAARWNLQPKADDATSAGSLPRIDAEAGGLDDDAPWLQACLTDGRYPLADPTGDGSVKTP
ncbi:MAG: lysozyme inhibitor LprI family protein [Inquilinus sp.]|uniref:lysozyme inhibitor LprI family protein n=1 Tax=Inquilinus sp. TaxID=1932117 RepID=UPI003F377DA3